MELELSFREKGLKKSTKRRLLYLIILFFVSITVSFFIINRREKVTVTSMPSPTLPTVSFKSLDTDLSELHGYTDDMDSLYMRDAVVPLSDKRELTAVVRTYGNKVSTIAYEVLSLDTERKISEEKVSAFSETGGKIRFKMKMANLIEKGEEYLFVLKLKVDGRTVRYYTRIEIPDDTHLKEYMDFALKFHDMALGKDLEGIKPYIEPDGTDEDPNELNDVTIHSTDSKIAWGGFSGKVVGSMTREIKEITDDYTGVQLSYVMEQDNSGKGVRKYYNVSEYFKVKYSGSMSLLDYERSMRSIFSPGDAELSSGNKLGIGIQSRDNRYISNETGTIVAFTADGRLYEYNQNTGEVMTVFSFGSDISDSRVRYGMHDIIPLNIDESGSLDFVVIGYMNAGAHEGRSGIDLFHFDSGRHQATEKVFISSKKSYQILKAGFSDLEYRSKDNEFYIIVDGTLLSIDLDTLKTKELKTGLKSSQYAVSGSSRYFVSINKDRPTGKIEILDLETGSKYYIKAPKGDSLAPLEFIGEDLIYGVMHESDIGTDAAGSTVYPMYLLRISSVSGGHEKVIKEYQKDGFYIKGVSKDDQTVYLKRTVRGSDGVFTDTDDDSIMDSTGEKDIAVKLVSEQDSGLGTVRAFKMNDASKNVPSVRKASTKLADISSKNTIELHTMDTETKYYVYVGANVTFSGSDVKEAITNADEQMGIVVDNKQTCIWRRGRKAYVNAMKMTYTPPKGTDSRSAAVNSMITRAGKNISSDSLNGQTPLGAVTSALSGYHVLDLTGITMEEALYYVSAGSPVYAETGNGAVLIIGYDGSNVYLLDPLKGSFNSVPKQQAIDQFKQAGNVYISYLK